MPELSELHDLQAAKQAEAAIQRDADNCVSDAATMYGTIATLMGNISERCHRSGKLALWARLAPAEAAMMDGMLAKVLTAWPALSDRPAPTFPDEADPPVESDPAPEVL